MIKKLFCVFFIILILISSMSAIFTVCAYEPTGFSMTSNAGMLISLDTGEMLYEKNIDKKVYPASITKIMTGLLMLESDKFNPTAKIAMNENILKMVLGTGSAVSNLKAGEEITHLDLLYYVLVSSSGDCALLAAEYFGETIENFVMMMNNRAKELGMNNTVYLNPTGLHEDGHYTTVRDIYTLASFAIKNETFKTVTNQKRYTVPETNMSSKRTISTTNFLIDNNTNYYYQYANGVKTGFTDEAGRCVVSTASYNGYNYMCIIMGCPDSKEKRHEFYETKELYRWAFLNFSYKKVASSDDPVCEIPVELSMETDFVSLYFKEPFVTILPNNADTSTLVINTKFENPVAQAPIKKGQVLGKAEILYAEKVIGTVDLVAGNSVNAHWILKFAKHIKNFFTSTIMKVIYVIVIVAILIFILLCFKLNYNRRKKRKVRYIPYSEKSDRKR